MLSKELWIVKPLTISSNFRASSVDFINKVIDEHSLAHEKVKLVFVVHPNGKKFMSLVLDLIMLATKEIMKRRNIAAGKSFDIEKVTQASLNMKEMETDLSTNIKIEADLIKVKTRAIQELIAKIFPDNEIPMSFEEFIEAWHEYNNSQLSEIKISNEKMKLIYKKTEELQTRAEELLLPRIYEINNPPLKVIKDVAAFYENAGVTNETIPSAIRNDNLNFSWLVAQLHLVLPTIMKYVLNFSLDSSDTSSEELKVLKRLSLELRKIESKTIDFASKFKKDMTSLAAKLKKAKQERQLQEDEILSPEILAERTVRDTMELERMNLLTSPKYNFDTTKECLNHVVVRKNRLPFMNEEEGKENYANETKYFQRSKPNPTSGHSRLNNTNFNATMKLGGMAPPNQKPRRRLDPMQMLEKATSNDPKTRQDLNSTKKYTGTVPKHPKLTGPKLSSTMISPSLHQPLFDYSTISEIIKGSPIVDSPGYVFKSVDTIEILQSPMEFDMEFFKAQKKPVDSLFERIEISPKGKINPLVKPDEIFKQSVKLALNDVTLVDESFPSEAENTVIDQNPNLSEGLSSSFSFGSIRLANDEDLFNISDSILKTTEY